jgi:hypothetical protein
VVRLFEVSQSDGRTVHSGLLRGIKLVEDDNARRDATHDYSRRRWDSTRHILAGQNIFVNEDTLELELIESFKPELERTYRELTGSREKAANFAALMEEPSENRTKIFCARQSRARPKSVTEKTTDDFSSRRNVISRNFLLASIHYIPPNMLGAVRETPSQ